MEKNIELKWITPNAEHTILEIARVSSDNPKSTNTSLINYLIKHQHWSPFEMTCMCVSIKTSRAISRQILRHRSFTFQELSQRYKKIENPWEARSEHYKNRQSSVEINDTNLQQEFEELQKQVWNAYETAIEKGIAKEQARSLLPEGLTETHLYMCGSIRSWIHYIELRTKEDTQKEHRKIAEDIKQIFIQELPITSNALGWIKK
jgi:thymidylate synthase (FAD)